MSDYETPEQIVQEFNEPVEIVLGQGLIIKGIEDTILRLSIG